MESRTSKSFVNVTFGLIQQVCNILFTFVTRTVFVYFLSKELLGINSLFTNILSILSLADLGLDTAMLYSFYKPLADKDEDKLCALVSYFKKIYIYIAIIVFIVGLLSLPFLEVFIGKDVSIANVEIYYLIFLIDTCFTYLLANRFVIINADQKGYIVKKYTFIVNFLKCLTQCLIIIITKNFMLYLIVQISCNFILNLVCARKAKQLYPYISKNSKLDKSDKKEIFTNIKSLIFYKIGGVIFANSDNIIISIMFGVICVGLYSNYIVLVNAISNIIAIIFTSVSFSVGNLIASGDIKQQYNVFKKLNFFALVVFGIFSVCLTVLLNNFIYLWIGEEFLLGFDVLIAIVINFYMQGLLRPIWVYRDSAGLFRDVQFLPVITSAINIVLSIVLGIKFGVFGIIAATFIARILTNFWYEPYILVNNYFRESFKEYLISVIKNISVTILSCCIFYYISSLIFSATWISFILTLVITVIGTLIIFILFYKNNSEFKFYVNMLNSFINKFKSKIIKVRGR